MANGTLTERYTVARKRPPVSEAAPSAQPPVNPEPTPAFGRIELQASPSWIDELDRVSSAMGISRSAYIRQACNRQMAEDRKIIDK